MVYELLDSLRESLDLTPRREGEVECAGADPVFETRFRVGEVAAAVLAACGIAVGDLWEGRGGRRGRVRIDVRAAAAALVSFAALEVAGRDSTRRRPPTVGLYSTGDGGWVYLHGGLPHLHDGLLDLLGCESSGESIARAVARLDAQALEDMIAERRLCGARVRSRAEWAAHPQGRALARAPVLEITRLGASDPEPLPPGRRPLEGVRVLDLTRILAGPTCARTLAEHGADVLRIHAPHLPTVEPFVQDTGHGKLSACLDLREPAAAGRLRQLVREADVFSRGYRAGALERLGFSVEELVALRPGLVVVSIDCYGHEGPWRERAGWEQLAQTVTGILAEQGAPGPPRLLPAAATDYTTGYLAALGAMLALDRRAREGGSYHVRVSLARTAMWLLEVDRAEGEPCGIDPAWLARYMRESEGPAGRMRFLGPVLELSETPPYWSRPSVPLGHQPPRWPARERDRPATGPPILTG
ncbi:MAG: CoA transferase [Myxococcota bacterium]